MIYHVYVHVFFIPRMGTFSALSLVKDVSQVSSADFVGRVAPPPPLVGEMPKKAIFRTATSSGPNDDGGQNSQERLHPPPLK